MDENEDNGYRLPYGIAFTMLDALERIGGMQMERSTV